MKFAGLRVVDLSSFLPGPAVSQIMADHGAEVIRVEPLTGEPARGYGPFEDGHSIWFRNLHRGKKSIALDLKAPEGAEIFRAMARRADVVIEGLRPGAMRRLGLDADTLRRDAPRLVYCSLSAYGQSGPLGARGTHDMGAQAMTGLLALNDGADGVPVVPGMPSADMACALMGLIGILAALLRRQETGRGVYVDASMYDSLIAFTAHLSGPVIAGGEPPTTATHRSIGGAAFYNIYRTRDDRFIALTGRETKFATNLLTALGREDLIPLCASDPGPDQQKVMAFLNTAFRERTLDEWLAFLKPLDVAHAPLLDMAEAFAHPHMAAREMLVKDSKGRKFIGTPLKFAEEPADLPFDVPALGQHSAEILADLGYADADIRSLAARGVVVCAD